MIYYTFLMQNVLTRCFDYEAQPFDSYVTMISPLRLIQGQLS